MRIGHFEPRQAPQQAQFATLIARALENRYKHPPVGYQTTNYIGHKQGRVEVIYYSHFTPAKKQNIHYWLVRCQCGEYELRTNKSLRRASATDMCEKCKETRYLQWLASGSPKRIP